ncbi:MAG: hypothetical protein KDC66_21070 [Phaeodactylibacter sp.]|nr:hypothetical protein [Phaeodactylibacter sp.]MCB9275337.1 hypothetical protein [Lewinellaceae bacterium]
MLVALLATWQVRDHAFFWDTVQLASRHAHWYYGQHFQHLLLPDEIDSGHPPGFGMYLAAVWVLFGKSLAASHLAMLPFLFGIIYLLYIIGSYFGGQRSSWMLILLAFAGPVLAGQSVLVSPDIVLVFAFLLALSGILYQKEAAAMAGALLLAAISTRGMMAVAVLYFFSLAAHWQKHWSFPLRKALPFVPSGLLALTFLVYHYQQKGWVGYHADAPWAPLFARATPKEALQNTAILAWRMLDYGRLFVWLPLAWLAYRLWKRRGNLSIPVRQALWLFALALPPMSIAFILYKGLHGHRYLLPVFIPLTILFYTMLVDSSLSMRWRYALFGLVFAGLLTGNLWVYPDTISQGWDSTLAHLPYYSLRKQMIGQIDKAGIPLEAVGTAFPEIGPLEYRDLNGDWRAMKEKDLATDNYILYSNVMNDFTDEEIRTLQVSWKPLKTLSRGGVRMVLYEKSGHY